VLYERPVNTFVAGFIGSPAMNLCRVPCSNGAVSLGGVLLELPRQVRVDGRSELVLGLRPESLELAGNGIPVEVEVVEELGVDAFVFGAAEVAGSATRLVARVDAKSAPARGARVAFRPRASETYVFDAATGARLGD
jgi:multiple sugar transport system ATP-binding protein